MGSKDAEQDTSVRNSHQNARIPNEKIRQGSTEKQNVEDELTTKQRDIKGVGSSSTIKAILPKLAITKFNGTAIDWIRFLNKFEAELDKSNLPSILKFPYLRILTEKKHPRIKLQR